MTTRERLRAVMDFQPFDRLPVVEWAGWWSQTLDRWHGEGLPSALTDRYEICRHFGLDVYLQDWFPVCGPDCPKPQSHRSGILGSMEEYERVRHHLYPLPAVDHERWEQWAREQERGDVALWFSLDGFFWYPRRLLGIERHFFAFYDQPELIHRMNADLAEWILPVIDEVCSICTPDFMTFAEDMSYNHGPMLSRELFDAFMMPYYHRVVPRLWEQGILPVIDSDGDVTAPAHWFEEAGLGGILPLERQAGVDIARLREEHPRMRFIGHFDKMVMHRGEAAIRAEFERLLPTAAGGGFLIGCDHQTPPQVSYEDYRLYVRLFREYAEEAGRLSRELHEPTPVGSGPSVPGEGDVSEKGRFGLLPPRHSLVLNPFTDVRFTRCPQCGEKTRIRKLGLLIHVQEFGLIVQGKTCRLCPPCDLLIVHQDELEAQLETALGEKAPEAVGNDYLVFGTVERKTWRRGIREALPLEEIRRSTADFVSSVRLEPA